jgi:tellurite resistance protein
MSKGVNEYFAQLHYGVTMEEYAPGDIKRFFLAVLKIVAADGLADRERWAFTELARHVGVPEHVVDALVKTDLATIDLAQVLAGFRDGVPARAMLYDAITVASVDGYTAEERKFARHAAELLGVDERAVRTIESIVAGEHAMRELKASLLEMT